VTSWWLASIRLVTQLALILLVSQLQFSSAPSAQAGATDSLQRLQRWVEAVDTHTPGAADRPAYVIGSWRRSELIALFPYIGSFVDAFAAEPRRSRPGVSTVDMEFIRALALGRRARPAPAEFVKRAAGFHADIAMLGVAAGPREPPSRQAQSSQFPARPYVHESDGQRGAQGMGHIHWDLARAILEFTTPDEGVQLWYRATTAHMMENGLLVDAMPHVAAALKLLPSSASALFAAGCLHERLASPRIDRVAQLDPSVRAGIGSHSSNVTLAERFFRKALSVDPSFAEASVRLGRLLAERGESATAAKHLRISLSPDSSRVVLYYRALFLGEIEADAGNAQAAAVAYREAQALFPRAQSPRLALGLLAIATGQLPDSDLLSPLRMNPRPLHDDPWWVYPLCEGRDAAKLVAALRATFNRATQ
jgi:tetratricopeptide (TPR) repeat protein